MEADKTRLKKRKISDKEEEAEMKRKEEERQEKERQAEETIRRSRQSVKAKSIINDKKEKKNRIAYNLKEQSKLIKYGKSGYITNYFSLIFSDAGPEDQAAEKARQATHRQHDDRRQRRGAHAASCRLHRQPRRK